MPTGGWGRIRLIVSLIIATVWTGAASEAADLELHYWTPGGGQILDAYEAAAQAYNDTHPGIRVEVDELANWEEKILVAISAGSPPEVFNDFARPTMRERVEQGAYIPLTSLLKRDRFPIDQIIPPAVEQVTVNGEIWGLPVTGTVEPVFYWNKDLFAEAGLDPENPPADWEELTRYSDKLTKIDPNGRMTRIGYAPTEGHIGDRWHFWILQNGGNIASPDGNRALGYLNSPQAVEAFQWAADFARRYGWQTFASFRGTWGSGAQEAFVSERAAMWGGSSPQAVRGILFFRPDFPLGYGLHPAPKGRAGIILLGGSANVIPRGVKNVEAAWDFVKWFSGERQTQLSRLIGYQSANVLALKATREVASSAIALALYPYARALPLTPAQQTLTRELRAARDAVIAGRMSPRAALDEAARKVQAAIDEYLAHQKK